jgi:hypothetical protein
MSRFSVAMARWMLVPSVLFSMFTMALPSWSFADDELAELTRLVDKLADDQTREEALEALSAKVDAAKDAGASEALQARLIDAWNNSKDPDNQQVKDGIKQVSRLIEGRMAVQRQVEKFTDDNFEARQAAEDELLHKGLEALRRGEYKNFARTITDAKKALVERLGKEEVPWEEPSVPEVKYRVDAVRSRLRKTLVSREDFQELKLYLESKLDQLDDAVATPLLRTTHAHKFDTYDKTVEDIKNALERGNTEEARTLISKTLPKAIDDTPFGEDKKKDMRDAVSGLIKWLESLEETDAVKGLKQMGMVLPVPAEKAFVGGDMPSGRIVVKGHVRTAAGMAVAGASIMLEAPAQTLRDFVNGTEPGWDPGRDARPPVVETSGPGGSFAVTLQEVSGIVPVSDVPVKDMIVTLDTRERYIVRLQPGIKPTDFVNDHGLQDVKIISVPSETGGGPLVTYPVPSDEKKAKELQDAISKDDRVASPPEQDDCREIQPNGRSEAMTIAYDYNTLIVGAGCDTMTMLIGGPGDTEPVPAPKKPEKWAVVVGVEDNPTLPVTGFANEGFHDANEFAQLLLKTGFAPEDLNPSNPKTPKEGTHMVTLLAGTGVGQELLPLLDEPLLKRGPGVAATNKRIDDALTWLAQVAKADDMVVFYFSGHGNADKTGAWFFSSDAKFAAQLLANKIQNITARKKLIILDFSKAEAFKSALEGLNGVILFGAETGKSISGQAIGRSVHKANGEQFHRHHPLTWELLRLWGKAPRPLRVPLKLEHFPTYFKLPENTDGLTLCGQLIPKNK